MKSSASLLVLACALASGMLRADEKKPVSSPQYISCNRHLAFNMAGVGMVFKTSGGTEITKVEALSVENTPVALLSTTVGRGGLLSTKDYGRLKLAMRSGVDGAQVEVFCTAAQERRLLRLKKAQSDLPKE